MKVHFGTDQFKNISSPVVTAGTFDGVHVGHKKILNRIISIAKEIDGESVLLTFEPHPRKILFNDNNLKLINTLDEKIQLLEKIGLDHLVVYPFNLDFSRTLPTSYVRDLLVKELNVKTLVIGYDHHFGRNREGDLALMEELSVLFDFNLVEIPPQEIDEIKVSSTKIRKALFNGQIKLANEYLGYEFSLLGTVITGNKIGRTIGFPTANLTIDESDKIIPTNGVYAVIVRIDNHWHKGMMNIGYRPTLNKETKEMRKEVHLFNFSSELYNKKLLVNFIAHIREEKKFSDINQLKDQLHLDQKDALQLLP